MTASLGTIPRQPVRQFHVHPQHAGQRVPAAVLSRQAVPVQICRTSPKQVPLKAVQTSARLAAPARRRLDGPARVGAQTSTVCSSVPSVAGSFSAPVASLAPSPSGSCLVTFTGVIVETPSLELGDVSLDQSLASVESEALLSVAPSDVPSPTSGISDVLQGLEDMSNRLSSLQQARAMTVTAIDDDRARALREQASIVHCHVPVAPPTFGCISEGGGSDHDAVATADVVEVLDELEHMESVLTSEKESRAQIVDLYEEQLREKSEAHARDVAMLEQMLQSAQLERQRLMAKAAKLQACGKKTRAVKAKVPSPTSTRSASSLVELDSTISSTASRGPASRLADLDSTQTSTASSRSNDGDRTLLGSPQQKVPSGASSECAETGSTTSDRPQLEQHMLEV